MKLQSIFKLNHRHVTKIVRRRRLGFERLDARRVLAAFVVDTLTDGPLAALAGDGHLSLREAIQAANTNASVDGSPRGESNAVDTIRFAASLTGAIKLSAGALVLDGRVELNGPGADRLTIDGDLKSGVLKVSSLATQATIRDLAIARGRIATSNGVGGGIANYGMLIVERVAVSDCIVGFAGGGIYNNGTLTLIASTIANNVADFQGGGIANDGTLNLIESTIALNKSLAGQTSGAQTKVVVATDIVGATNNRIEIKQASVVSYAGANPIEVIVPPSPGSITIPSTELAVRLGNPPSQEFFRAPNVQVTVTVTNVEMNAQGVLVIDDDVIGNADPQLDGTVSYSLSVSRNSTDQVTIAGREFSLVVSSFSLNGTKNVGETDSFRGTVKLLVGPNSPSHGGGIYNRGVLSSLSSSIVGNTASDQGGGIYFDPNTPSSNVLLDHTLLTRNRNDSGSEDDYRGTRSLDSSSKFNLVGAAGDSGLINQQSGNRIGDDWTKVIENDGVKPILKANGGNTKTVTLIKGSPAIDHGSATYDSSSIPNDQRGPTFSRIVDGDMNGSSIVDVGAVEFAPTKYDFGDAPSSSQSGLSKSYPVLLAQNGARHAVSNLFLGGFIDYEFDGFSDARAGVNGTGGDDGNNVDDEDGVNLLSTLVTGVSTNISSASIVSSGGGFVDAWIDFNRDGDWDDPGEKIIDSVAVLAGTNLVGFSVPGNLSAGAVFARFRLSSSGLLLPTGVAADGEVEDMQFELKSSAVPSPIVFQTPIASKVEILSGPANLELQINGRTVFRASPSDGSFFQLVGSSGDDTFQLDSLDLATASKLSLSGGLGLDSIAVKGSGITLDLPRQPGAITSIETVDIRGSGANRLNLNVDSVQQLSGGSELHVIHDADDTVALDAGWTLQKPKFENATFVQSLTNGTAALTLENNRPYHNPYSIFDVDRSNSVDPLDVLAQINYINAKGIGALAPPTTNADLSTFLYLDVDNDNSIGPLDVLKLINFLNSRSAGGEGEFVDPNWATFTDDPFHRKGAF